MHPATDTPRHRESACPMHAVRGLSADDELVLPKHRSVVTQYHVNDEGVTELRLFHGDKEISFDDAGTFGFGEQLAVQSRFVAGAATGWGDGYPWDEVAPLLQTLIDEGVLRHALPSDDEPAARHDGARPDPLPPAPCAEPTSWDDCEALVERLTGRPLEPGHLELVMPVFRVAHIALDADGRQVGEANVFPKALRLAVPTAWRACIYPGTRFQDERPMNVTALKAMRQHWGAMMVALARVREGYLQRFPQARAGWTVGHLERLATAVLAVTTLPLVRQEQRVRNGELHPALSCLFRVTDGLRMTMHQMLFVPVGEPTLPPDAPMTGREVLAYAERNWSFHSEHGVCAGPRAMIEEFLAVLVDGQVPPPCGLDPAVQAALDDLEPALDYALLGLQAYGVVFSLWPAMTRAYEDLLGAAEAWAVQGAPKVVALRDRLRAHIDGLRRATYLGNESWRADREHVYADMVAQCAFGLGGRGLQATLAELTARRADASHAVAARRIAGLLATRLDAPDAAEPALLRLRDVALDFLARLQGVLRAGSEVQARINTLLGRAQPLRPFGSAEVDIHNLLQGETARRIPYLVDELGLWLGASITVTPQGVAIESGGMVPAEPHADGVLTTWR